MPRQRRYDRQRRGAVVIPVGLWGWLVGELTPEQALDVPNDGASGIDKLDVFLITGGGRELQDFIAKSPDVVTEALKVYAAKHGGAAPPWYPTSE